MSALLEHLGLVVWSTSVATIIGVPLGIVAERRARVGAGILAGVAILQVIPSLALFAFLLPLPWVGGIGARTASVALVVYALLPIVRATSTGIAGIDASVREAAVAIGMTPGQRLQRVELPLALPVIASGVRTALVIGVGVATIAAAIGAGGFGQLIFRGLRMNDNGAMVQGALGAAGLALALDFLLALVVRRLAARRGVALFLLLPLALLAAQILASRGQSESGSGAGTGSVTGSVTICCKDFSEQLFLGETLAKALEARGIRVIRRFDLGGNLCHDALLAGEVDIYPEYTGTALVALLHESPDSDPGRVLARVQSEYARRFHLDVSAPIGFANDFAILVRQELPASTISELAPLAPHLRAGFGQDFMSRPDGYAGFARLYNLVFAAPPVEMELSLTYRALADKKVDVIAGNSTDGLIDALSLKLLADDKHYFPPYQAVWISRPHVREQVRDAIASIHLSTAEMRRANAAALTQH